MRKKIIGPGDAAQPEDEAPEPCVMAADAARELSTIPI